MRELIINKIRLKNERSCEIERFAQFGKISHEFLHDILNPISSVLLQLEILKEGYLKEDNLESDIEEINKINNRIIKLIRLFQKNLIENDDAELININNEIKEIISLNYYKAQKNRVSIVIIEEDNINIKIPKIKFYQLIMNLLSNSIDSFENITDSRKRKISIRISKTQKTFEISFSDNGCGMTEREAKNIFKNRYSKKKKGFGIGLKTTRKIIRDLDGYIKIESEIDKGSTFKIEIPIKKFRLSKDGIL